MTKFLFAPGEVLPNGAVIKDCAYLSVFGYWVVVAHWSKNSLPWVRWCCDAEGNANWGRYWATYDEAYQCFVDKVTEAGNR